jgi:hypothetical protein
VIWVARLPGGWTLSLVPLSPTGHDAFGWWWGSDDRPLWHCADGADSVTVRAGSIDEACDALRSGGWPPRTVGKIGWSAVHHRTPN